MNALLSLPTPAAPAGFTSKPAQLLQAFAHAKQQRNLGAMQAICKQLEQGWAEVPVWQRGRNNIQYQRQRLSPYVRYSRNQQEAFYKAYMQAVLDPEYRAWSQPN